MREKSGQQEIAGFVIIVVLVIVALMVFIVVSLRQTPVETKSRTAENVLSSVLSYTTDCIVSQPYLDSVRDLIKHCYENQRCNNLDMMACSYLNETLDEMLPDLLINPAVSGTISAYEFKINWIGEDDSGFQSMMKSVRGSCNQTSSIVTSADDIVDVNDGTLNIQIKICSEV